MMDPDAQESMVLEEDIDENYEPTEEEILEYAKFLGMDLQKDRDLFYIAKEGLKAPLPEPWKPCQTRDGEIYYFNFETGDSTWDHPCDEYYKKMYEREKQKKNERLMQSQAQKMRGSGFTEDTRGPLAGPGLGSKKQGKAPLKIEDLPKLSSVGKKDDPLLKAANEKKLKQYKEQKEKEIQQQIQTLQTKFENKKKELERQHQKKIKDLELEYEMKKAQEEDKIRRENKPLEESDIPIEKKKREAELRAEAEKNLAHKIKLLQEELSLQLEDAKEKLNLNKQQKQKEIRSQLEKQYSEEIQALESEIFKLKMEQNASAADDLESLEQNAKKSYINEQEIKFQMEKEALIQSFKEKTEELKEKALHKQREEISNLYKKFEAENAKNEKEEIDPAFEAELARELKEKVEDYKNQINNKIEIMKLEVQEKMLDYEKEKMAQFRESLDDELAYLNQELQKYKEGLEADFVKEKARLQKKNDDEIAALRQLTLEQIQEKKKALDEEQLEKISILKLKMNRIKGFDGEEASELKAKLGNIEDLIAKSQRALKAKHDEYTKEQIAAESLKKEIQFIENRYKTELGVMKKTLGVAGDLDAEIETLTRVLAEKDAKIEELRAQKAAAQKEQKTDIFRSMVTVKSDDHEQEEHEPRFANIDPEDQYENQDFNIDKLQVEVRNLKEFLKTHISGVDRSSQYSLTKKGDRSSQLLEEIETDRKLLIEKRDRFLKNKEILERDLQKYGQDPEKIYFLQDMREILKKKLNQVNSQLEYLKTVEKKLGRDTENRGLRTSIPRIETFKADIHEDMLSSLPSDDLRERYVNVFK